MRQNPRTAPLRSSVWPRALVVAIVAALALVGPGAGTAAAAKAPPALVTGVHESLFKFGEPTARSVALARTRATRARLARVIFEWWNVARTRPPSRQAARDPSWSGYLWGPYDQTVQAIRAAGLEPLITVFGAPPWAEGAERPSSAPVATWRPSASAFRDFAEAAARRYSGSIQPRVRYWQGWNEPNLVGGLSPQWESVGGRLVAASPGIYKGLLNAFYDGVKAGGAGNFVITAGTSPFGDGPGSYRMRPAYFWRQVLCTKGGRKPRAKSSCPGGAARFDALAHHPYTIGPPSQRAANGDDVTLPDFAKLNTPLKLATSKGYVFPKRSKQVWVTELAMDTNPPDPDGVPISRQAKYLQGSMYLLWKQGVDVFTWLLLRDEDPSRGFGLTRQSGLYSRGATIAQDRAKPALTAFRFPFTAYRRSASTVQLWGLAPQRGKVVVERRTSGGDWTAVSRPKARGNRVFVGTSRVNNGAVLRARQAGETSLSWRVTASGP